MLSYLMEEKGIFFLLLNFSGATRNLCLKSLLSGQMDHGLIYCFFILLYKLFLKLMSALPTNVEYFLKQYKQKMSGSNDTAINTIKQSLQRFNKERSQEIKLRHIQIFPYKNQKGIQNQFLYVIRIKGRKNTYYQKKILTFYMFLFDSYPNQPPEIIAGHCYDLINQIQIRFLHINVAESGQFCMKSNQKNQEYFENTTLKDILVELQNTLYFPNIASSFNNQLYQVYNAKGDNSKYYKLLNAQARILEEDDISSQDSQQNQKQM